MDVDADPASSSAVMEGQNVCEYVDEYVCMLIDTQLMELFLPC